MKLKLDENLGLRGRELLATAGHDVCTVAEQNLSAATDEEVARRCAEEGRAVVTLDLDFSNPLRFPPDLYPGIAVLRGSSRQSKEGLDRMIHTLISALQSHSLEGQLWIVEEGRVRIFQPS